MLMTPEDARLLAEARRRLESESFAVKLVRKLGQPIEQAMKMLPRGVEGAISAATAKALTKALRVAATGLEKRKWLLDSDFSYKVAVGVTGAVGGAFSLPALAIELPATTLLMLRSVAEIAQEHGEDLSDPEARLSCLEVFSMGGPDRSGHNRNYYALRAALQQSVNEAARHLASEGLRSESANWVVRLVQVIAGRFEVIVTEKVAATLVPVIGAATGATLNTLFMKHFQDMARGHFTLRQLERRYGLETVRAAYEGLAPPAPPALPPPPPPPDLPALPAGGPK